MKSDNMVFYFLFHFLYPAKFSILIFLTLIIFHSKTKYLLIRYNKSEHKASSENLTSTEFLFLQVGIQ